MIPVPLVVREAETASQNPPSSTELTPPFGDALYASAQTFARSGLQALAADNVAMFLLHAGMALEHLSKSLLASLHGSLIASPRHFSSLMYLSGLDKQAGIKPSQIRTINMAEALERAGKIVPQMANLTEPLQALVDGRNGVAHAALVDPDAAERVVVPFLQACDLLLGAMDRDRAQFWEDLVGVVDARVAASAEAANIRALEKIAFAREAFEVRIGGLEAVAREALLLGITGSYAPQKYEQTLVSCPACSTPALVEGTITVDWEPDWDYSDGESYIAGVYATVTIFPQRLECRACGLGLEGEAELAAAGVSRSWKLEDVDQADFDAPSDEGWDDF